jgi:hypothetical protein
MCKKNDEVLEATVSRPTSGFPFGDIVVLTAALAALAACGSNAVAPASDSAASLVSTGPAVAHVRDQPTRTASASGSTPPHAISEEFANPERVAVAEARAVCNFDWRQPLTARIQAAGRYATDAYAHALSPSANDSANWTRTQQDHESATCTGMQAFALLGAPNTPTVRYERVEMTQLVRVAGRARTPQRFEVSYRVERQYDGRWLVGADSDGG